MENTVTLLIADDHPVFRKGLRDAVQGVSDLEVVGEAGNGEVALGLITELRPQVAIVDIEMPVMSGFDLVKALRARQVPVDVIFLTMYKEEDIFNEAMDLCARGYVLKESAVHDILECIRIVSNGGYYVSPLLSVHLIRRNNRQKEFETKHAALASLTLTERKILRLISENKTSQEIADELFISRKTVENHRMTIVNKLDLHGHHNLLKFALENKSNL